MRTGVSESYRPPRTLSGAPRIAGTRVHVSVVLDSLAAGLTPDQIVDEYPSEPGELRCVFIESQPPGRDTMHWRIADAATGRLDEGHARVSGLLAHQPWGSELLAGSVR